MRRFLTLTAACLAVLGMTALAAGCGDDEETTTTDVETTSVETTVTATTPTTTGTETTTGTTTTGGTTTSAEDCGEGEVYSSSIGQCVEEREGKNPCPSGEVPMADEPTCVPKD